MVSPLSCSLLPSHIFYTSDNLFTSYWCSRTSIMLNLHCKICWTCLDKYSSLLGTWSCPFAKHTSKHMLFYKKVCRSKPNIWHLAHNDHLPNLYIHAKLNIGRVGYCSSQTSELLARAILSNFRIGEVGICHITTTMFAKAFAFSSYYYCLHSFGFGLHAS